MEVNSEVDTTDSELNVESNEHLTSLLALFILEPENFKFGGSTHSQEPENFEVGGCTHSKVAPFMEPCGHIRWRNQRTLKLEVVPIPRWLLSWSPVATKEGGGFLHGALLPHKMEVNSEVDIADLELNKESYEHLSFLSAPFI
ncbi:unnamed protein product [Orchesella dallaii]|uniref:Uncharacterized protein n=1 Tax=Orchesella dallaii TaxID=48710 RepID=A0ABP1Q2Q7_9HEXA